MEKWPTRPDRGEHPTQLQLIRVPPGKSIGGIVLCNDATGAYTHYWRGRTAICTAPACDACDAHRLPRWYGYLAVQSRATKTIALLELTPSCLPALDAWLDEYGSLRGAEIDLTRATKKPNSRLLARLRSSEYAKEKLPPPPNVRAHLARIWEIADLAPTDDPRPTDLHGQRTLQLPADLAGKNGRPI